MTENTDSCVYNQLWQHYSETVFLLEQPLPDWPQACIITACNPRGNLLGNADNALQHDRLCNHLNQLNLAFIQLTGCSPDLKHRESSLMVYCTKGQTMSLAKRFQQNAFFWIEHHQLYLCPCLLKGQSEQHLGRFDKRLIRV